MPGTLNKDLAALIKEKASELDFDLCGIARSVILEESGKFLKNWCETGMNAGMTYLGRDIEKRVNPGLIINEAKSVVVTGLSYYTAPKQKDPDAPVMSIYSYGNDYHSVITGKLEKLYTFIQNKAPGCEGRLYVDTGPVLEKRWAVEAGLGWQGKNSVIINRDIGSFFFIGVLILNIEITADMPFTEDLCGSCTRCIDQCPTGAINMNRSVDTRKCLANLTINNRGPVPDEIIPNLGGRVYGCDRCQEVCPWNDGVISDRHPEFKLNEEVASLTKEQWMTLTRIDFERLFHGTVVAKNKYESFKSNIHSAIKSME